MSELKKISLALQTPWSHLMKDPAQNLALQKQIVADFVFLLLGPDERIKDFNNIADVDEFRQLRWADLNKDPSETLLMKIKFLCLNLMTRSEFLAE